MCGEHEAEGRPVGNDDGLDREGGCGTNRVIPSVDAWARCALHCR